MKYTKESKMGLAEFMAEHTFIGMNECEKYGMTWGCDIDCPVLKAGKCKLKDDENKELWDQVKEDL